MVVRDKAAQALYVAAYYRGHRLRRAILEMRPFIRPGGRREPFSAASQPPPRTRVTKLVERFCRCGSVVSWPRVLCEPCREEGRHRNERRRNRGKVCRKAAKAEILFGKQKGRCFYCLKKLPADYHIDHFIPRARGGGNRIENLRLACPDCNIAKSDKPPEEFLGVLLI
jgi:5-methylcytosine-specific restriction endonuclease McrA